MASQKHAIPTAVVPASAGLPKSITIAERGIQSSADFRDFMSAIMSDVISGRLTPSMTNAACNAGGKLLKMVDLEYKYSTSPERLNRRLTVAFEVPQEAVSLGSGTP